MRGFCSCGEEFDLKNCSPSVLKGGRGQCSDCRRAYEKDHRNKPGVIERYRKTRSAAKRKMRIGVTRKQFEDRFEKQKGLCAICQEPMKIPCQDHCHLTGKIRDLLCRNCNLGLAGCRERVEILQKMIDYIFRHNDSYGLRSTQS